jgi:hypothetical protein
MIIRVHRVREQQQTSASMAGSSHIEQNQPRHDQRIVSHHPCYLLAIAQRQCNMAVFAARKRDA